MTIKPESDGFLTGDTVKLYYEATISDSYTEEFIKPGSFTISTGEKALVLCLPYRYEDNLNLFFGFKNTDKAFDLWMFPEHHVVSCRMVLTEKFIPQLDFNDDEINEYGRHSC